MKPIIDLLRDRQSLSEAQFVRVYPFPLLLHRLRVAESINMDRETQFARPLSGDASSVGGALLTMGLATAKARVHLNRVVGRLRAPGEQEVADGAIVVFGASSAPGPEGLSIGRSPEAHYCLPYTKISKIHARLLPEGRSWALLDGGSRNGTQLDGAPVTPGRPVPLADGALLQLSQYQFLFHTPAGLYRSLGED